MSVCCSCRVTLDASDGPFACKDCTARKMVDTFRKAYRKNGTELDLGELERLEQAATPGPWEICGPWPTVSIYQTPQDPEDAAMPIANLGDNPRTQSSRDDPDARLIVAARNVLPQLIARLRAAEARTMELSAECDELSKA